MSVSCLELVANNLNSCFSKDDLTAYCMGHNYWTTMNMLDFFLFWDVLINFLLHQNLLKKSNLEQEKYCRQRVRRIIMLNYMHSVCVIIT